MKGIGIQVNDNNDSGEILDLKVDANRGSDGKILHGLAIGNTVEQNKAFILMAHPGDQKLIPALGVGISDLILGSDYLEYRHKIREEFAKDNLRVTRVDLYEDMPFKIDADYDK